MGSNRGKPSRTSRKSLEANQDNSLVFQEASATFCLSQCIPNQNSEPNSKAGHRKQYTLPVRGISLPPYLTQPSLPSHGTVPTAASSVMNWGQELIVWCYYCSEPWSLLLTYVCLFHRATLLCQIPPEPKSDPEERALRGARISQRRAGIIH